MNNLNESIHFLRTKREHERILFFIEHSKHWQNILIHL